MKLTPEFMLERFLARDAAWDGRFLTGVVTTGIYCLPSCTARKPRPENVRFFESEDAARAAGLRACRRCRPHHFYRERDPDLERLEAAFARVAEDPAAFLDVAALARAAECGATKLNALARKHFHATPLELLVRARIAAARVQLASSKASAAEVAFAVGFESLSAFHEHFRELTGLSPGAYRRLRGARSFELELPPDFRLDLALPHLARDPEETTERLRDGVFERALLLGGRPATLRCAIAPQRLMVEIEGAAALPADSAFEAHAALVRMLALEVDPRPFERRVRSVRGLGPLIADRAGLRPTRSPGVFEMLCWTVAAQQVNLPFAFRCRRALCELAGTRAPGGLWTHPTPESVARLDYADLERRQFSRRKAEFVIDAARAIHSGELELEALAAGSATRAERELARVRGLGRWSVQSLLMRGLGFADCAPIGDAGLARSLQELFELDHRPDERETEERMRPFAPYRSLATMHLWRRLT